MKHYAEGFSLLLKTSTKEENGLGEMFLKNKALEMQ